MLTLHGLPITVDITDTSYAGYDLVSYHWSRNQSPEFLVIPGGHVVSFSGRSDPVPFDVTPAGRVDYDPQYDSIFTGRGTTTLTAHGTARITVDITDTSYSGYGMVGYQLSRNQSSEFVLIPGRHEIDFPGRPDPILFDVTPAGLVGYDPQYDSIFTGRGTTTLAVHGFPVTIDARSATFVSFSVPGVVGPVDAQQLRTFGLVPGTHQVVPSAGATIEFSVTGAGDVDYDSSLDGVLGGRGTSTLVFRGPTFGLVLLFGCVAGPGSLWLLPVGLAGRGRVRRRIKTRSRLMHPRWVNRQ